MRYPVGRDTQELDDKWYSAQGYGDKTSYGYHEGEDLNLKTGGNTDLGQPVYSIANGTVTAVQKLNVGFGYNVHIKHEGAWGVCYSHYAHLQNIKVVSGQEVGEGQKIAEVGHTGNSRYNGVPVAHLHFAIKKKPTGLGAIAHNLTELHNGWYNPLPFIKKYMNTSSDNTDMTEQQKKDLESMKKLREYKGTWYESQDIIRDYEELKKENQKFADRINEKETVISKQSEALLKLTDELDTSRDRVKSLEGEVLKKEELRDKWYKMYQQSQDALKTAKDQATYYQKQWAIAQKKSLAGATVKQMLIEILQRILK